MLSESSLQRLDRLFDRWSERLNPIVVKETRQALKSRGFSISFLVMLALCWGISIVGVVGHGEDLYYSESGPEFLFWYLACLHAACCFVVPTTMFRSVVSEFEGQTFEMLAITSLSPRQIVFGKLKSSLVQMGAFYSAAAPFICFTYMLQGLSIPGILVAILFSLMAGLFTCMGAMMLASLARQSAWQVVCLLLSVGLGLITFSTGLQSAVSIARETGSSGWGVAGLACVGLACFGYVFLFFSLLTIGVSIAQFTPTMPRPRHQSFRLTDEGRSFRLVGETPRRKTLQPAGGAKPAAAASPDGSSPAGRPSGSTTGASASAAPAPDNSPASDDTLAQSTEPANSPHTGKP